MEALANSTTDRCLNDDSFGPFVDGCRDNFDFTKVFEQSILSIAPSACFVLLALGRLVHLWGKPVLLNDRKSRQSQHVKTTTIVVYAGLQVALLALACSRTTGHQQTSVPAASLNVCSALAALVLSAFEHSRTWRPSTILSVYLFFSLLFDTTQSRTYWLSNPSSPFTKVLTASIASKLAILVLEAQSKAWLIGSDHHYRLSPEQTSGIFSKSSFSWLNDILRRGYRTRLSATDLYTLDEDIRARKYRLPFWQEFERRGASGCSRPLLLSILSVLRGSFLAPVLPRLVLGALTFTQPLFINAVLKYLQDDPAETSNNAGYAFIGAAAFIYIGIAVSTGFYWYFQQRFLAKVRSCLGTAIYHKTVHNDVADEKNSSALTLMNSDVLRIQGGITEFHDCWVSIIEIGVASWLLQRQIGLVFLSPIGIVTVCLGLTFTVAGFAGKRQRRFMTLLEKRVALSSAIIPSLLAIKMSALDSQFGRLIQTSREKEINSARRFRVLTVVTATLAFAPILLSPVVTFAVGHDRLDVRTAFTSLGYINLLCNPLTHVIQAVPQLLASLTCLGRVEEFLRHGTASNESSLASTEPDDILARDSDEAIIAVEDTGPSAIVLENASFGWSPESWTLDSITLNMKPSTVNLVTGGIASGKTTLCKALLREIPRVEGQLSFTPSPNQVAYCDQDPFLFNASIRENVLGFSTFNGPWYEQVIQACQLSEDISSLPEGDGTRVGSKGISLSGGQRKRICLARAIYCKPDVAVLDDPLSGVDSVTEEQVVREVFGQNGIFRNIKTTVVFASQSDQHLEVFDQVIVVGNHEILYQGQQQQLDSLRSAIHQFIEQASVTPQHAKPGKAGEVFTATPILAHTTTHDPADPLRLGGLSEYRFYFKTVGYIMLVPFFGFATVFAFLYNFGTVWLEIWQDANDSDSKFAFYIGIFFMLQILCLSLLALFAGYGGTVMGPKASRRLHLGALKTLLQAPLAYYTTVDAAVPIGYFAQDMSLIDQDVSLGLDNTVLTGLTAIGQAAVIGVASPYIFFGYPVLASVLFLVQRIYLRTSKQIRLLVLETREPL